LALRVGNILEEHNFTYSFHELAKAYDWEPREVSLKALRVLEFILYIFKQLRYVWGRHKKGQETFL